MHRRRYAVFFAFFAAMLAAPALRAQLSHTATALNTMSCVAGSNGDSIPAGDSLSPSNSMSAFFSGSFQLFSSSGTYQTSTLASGLQFSLAETSSNQSSFSGGGSAATGPNQSLWVIQAPQPVAGTLRVVGSSSSFTVFNTRVAQVDIGNDGTIDWSLASGTPLQVPLTVAGSLTIRVVTQTAAALGQVSINVGLSFAVQATKATYGTGCGSPLTLDSNLPVIGTNWNFTTTQVDAVSPVAFTFFGDRGPAVPLSALGFDAPGCFLHLASALSALSGPNLGGSTVVTVAIPLQPTLIGLPLSGQSLCLSLANPSLLVSSNGVEGIVGS
ncbi:MAG: hypothetical protein MUC36_04305 [Planctomycetes bacterium]|jgi:hypothetical protein|nr:hypothetical protein [Planctomycetota bacterium]